MKRDIPHKEGIPLFETPEQGREALDRVIAEELTWAERVERALREKKDGGDDRG